MKKLLALLTVSALLVIPTSSSFLINKVSNINANYYAENNNEMETKIKDIWNKDFKNKLNSAQKYKDIFKELQEKLNQDNNLKSVSIKLADSSLENKRFRFDSTDRTIDTRIKIEPQSLDILLDNQTIKLELGSVKRA
ncbi:conserved domain protein [Mycoplasma leachii PG50]|uniref:Conserved domain protein n=1 Tax=Mycoplasma leachii (strain DSM 21131 / NCTC 10133 / N29 / PG50) TaxID=880447 RepID=E4PU71_MYCLG